jgi:hypothetical protein
MELQLRLQVGDTTHEVTSGPWHIMLWERRYKTKISRIQTDGLGLEDMTYMAYEVLKGRGVEVPASFDQFAQQVKNVEYLGDSADPTPAAVSAGSSPRSPQKPE